MKKICPICDLPVNEMNYCPRCRRMVRQPVLWQADYYLNERRPDYENRGEPHKPVSTGTQQKWKIQGNQQSGTIPGNQQSGNIPGNQQKRNIPGNPQKGNVQGSVRQNGSIPPFNPVYQEEKRSAEPVSGHKPSQPAQSGQAKKRRNSLTPLTGVITLLIVLNAVPKVIGSIGRLMDEKNDYGNYETAVPYDDSGFTELEEEEVKASKTACDGYIHFPADGSQIAAALGQFFKETDYGYQVEDGTVYSDNYLFEEESGPISYYETVESYSLEDQETGQLDPGDENYVYQYVDINYDTATGELHDYISSLKDREVSLVYLQEFLRLTEAAAGIPQEESSIPAIMDQARTKEWQEDGLFISEGMFDINAYLTDDGIRIYVSCSNPQVMESQET